MEICIVLIKVLGAVCYIVLSMIFILFLVDNFMLIEVYFYIEMVLDA